MSLDSLVGTIKHTQGPTWGGSQINPTVFKVVSALGGFFGLDHVYLRSPKTGFFKFLVNILTLGFWYFYDLAQVFSESDHIRNYGLTIPFLGPSGIGAGIFHGDGVAPAPDTSPNPLLFLAFASLISLPFGLSHFIAGDFYGGAAKFFITFSFFFFMGFIWAAFSTFNVIANTPEILQEGTDRFFPFTMFMAKTGSAPNIMIPKPETKENFGLSSLLGLTALLGPLEKPILEAVVGVGETGINAAENVKNVANTIENMGTQPAVQSGGASSLFDSSSNFVFLGMASLVLFGSLVMTAVRYTKSKKNKEESDDIPPEANNDVPPPGSGVF